MRLVLVRALNNLKVSADLLNFFDNYYEERMYETDEEPRWCATEICVKYNTLEYLVQRRVCIDLSSKADIFGIISDVPIVVTSGYLDEREFVATEKWR